MESSSFFGLNVTGRTGVANYSENAVPWSQNWSTYQKCFFVVVFCLCDYYSLINILAYHRCNSFAVSRKPHFHLLNQMFGDPGIFLAQILIQFTAQTSLLDKTVKAKMLILLSPAYYHQILCYVFHNTVDPRNTIKIQVIQTLLISNPSCHCHCLHYM